MRLVAAATTISWIPSEAITGIAYKTPFEIDVAHYDDPPPDTLPDVDAYLAADGARFANQLRAWAEVRDGEIVDFGHTGQGSIGSTTLRLAGRKLTFLAYPLPEIRRATQLSPTSVRFEQTAGGRTGVPAPRRVKHAPYFQFLAPLAWSTVAVTLHADGSQVHEIGGASPFPRHWLYDASGALSHKSATIDYHEWSISAYGRHTPWGDSDSPALVSAVETALERQLSMHIMRAGRQPELRRLKPGDRLTSENEIGNEVFLLLDGVLRVEVGGEAIAELGPGAVLGERATLESGRRTATLVAATPCLVAVADPASIDTDMLRSIAQHHRRETVVGTDNVDEGE